MQLLQFSPCQASADLKRRIYMVLILAQRVAWHNAWRCGAEQLFFLDGLLREYSQQRCGMLVRQHLQLQYRLRSHKDH